MFARKSGCCSASREREDTPTFRCTRASTPRACRKLADLASTRELEQESAGQGRLLRSGLDTRRCINFQFSFAARKIMTQKGFKFEISLGVGIFFLALMLLLSS